MNIAKLEKLADTVRPGIWRIEAPDRLIAFNMGTCYQHVSHRQYANNPLVPVRDDVPNPREVNLCACLIGYTMELWGDQEMMRTTRKQDPEWVLNWQIEATNILGLDDETAWKLFFDTTSPSRSGEDAYRVIRKLLLTGEVDWGMVTPNYVN